MSPFVAARSIRFVLAFVLLAVSPLLHAQYTEVHNFDWHQEGANPMGPALLTQGLDGSLYGTLQTQLSHDGSVFSIAPDGTVLDLYDFLGKPDGNTPQSGLSFGWDGNFYGATERGGTSDKGTVFKYRDGVMTILYNFTDGTDGAFPWAPPIQAPDGNIYGVTDNGTNPGKAYKINLSTGAFSVIATLPSQTIAPLILGTDGNLYGTTPNGGTFNQGTVFRLTTKGVLKIVHSFGTSGTEGKNPAGPVLQAADGKLYGTTNWGGANGFGSVFVMSATGGGYKTLHSFQAIEGENPPAGMVQGSDGFLYSVATRGGANSQGTLFKINTQGTTFTVLHDFGTSSGDTPMSTPVLHTNGIIYGTTNHGGSQQPAYGVLYSYDASLKPFISLVIITSGHVGDAAGILGQGFLSATGVTFGGGPGKLIPINDTAAIISPLAGAMTGPVKVSMPTGDLVTPQTFKVLPSISDFNPKSGPVGTVITITGMSLKQTTSVTIGRVVLGPGVFNVVSDTAVTATVPAGVTSPAKVSLKTKGGSAIARGSFTVQ
ncbi:MAG: IPT/TIG domain-containing protein [Acidobacteria bacterium]|nr:IPT/TIG domain-containing protein [Acidobacteriota bacterium]